MPGMLRSQAARAQRRLGLDEGRQLALDLGEGRGQRRDHGVDAQVQVGAVLALLLLLGRAVVDQLAAPATENLEILRGGAGLGAQLGAHLGGEPGQDLRVQPVGLGQAPEGAGEVAGLARIDADDRQAGRGQGGDHDALVAAAGFQHDAGRPPRLELLLQAPQPAPRARHRPGRAAGLDRDVQLRLGHIDPDRDVRGSCHWVPSGHAGDTPCLADSGSWLRPRHLFGLCASARAGTTLLSHGLLGPRGDRSVPARALSPWRIQSFGNIQGESSEMGTRKGGFGRLGAGGVVRFSDGLRPGHHERGGAWVVARKTGGSQTHPYARLGRAGSETPPRRKIGTGAAGWLPHPGGVV